MRTFTSLLLACIMAFTAYAAEKNTTILVRQLNEDQRALLPDKTIEITAQNLKLKPKNSVALFAQEMIRVLTQFAEEDFCHYVYCVTIVPHPENNTIGLEAIGIGWLDDNMKSDAFFGAYHLDRALLLFTKDSNNESLLKSIFGKDKGKHHVVQEFEMAEEAFNYPHSQLKARWDGAQTFEIVLKDLPSDESEDDNSAESAQE